MDKAGSMKGWDGSLIRDVKVCRERLLRKCITADNRQLLHAL